MSKKALVTGASGFVGSTLIEELNAQGYEVHALMRKTSSSANLDGLRYQRVEGELSDSASLARAVVGMDYIFHVAGVVTAPNRAFFFEHNAEGTRRLIEAASKNAPTLKKFVLVSSLAAAGPATSASEPKLEGHSPCPVSDYGQSKLQAEVEALKFKDKVPLVIVRPPMVYGPRDKAIFTVIQTVGRRLMPIIRGGGPDGNKFYSLVQVNDLCRGIVQAAEVPSSRVPSGEIFFLTEEGMYTYRELLLTIARSLRVRPVEVRVPYFAVSAMAGMLNAAGKMTGRTYPLNLDKLNEIRPDYWVCSSRKAKEMLGFSPKYDLSAGMADAIRWYREKNWI